MGTLERKGGSTHKFQGRCTCLLFTYQTLPSKKPFVPVVVLTSAFLYNAGVCKLLISLGVGFVAFDRTFHVGWLLLGGRE